MTAFLMLAPGTPMLFQGQEFASSKPFYYFADQPDLAELVRNGRREFMHQWRSIAIGELDRHMIDPCAESTFLACKLDHSEREKHRKAYELHADLVRLRREDPVLRVPRPRSVDGAVLSSSAFLLRYFNEQHGDRLLIVNLGRDTNYNPAPEPLLAPPENKRWGLVFSTESPKYGGWGTAPVETDENWCIPGGAAVVFAPRDLTGEERRRPLKAIWRQSARRDKDE
jgi:maltooligosyltrehalose trehalohydrolase